MTSISRFKFVRLVVVFASVSALRTLSAAPAPDNRVELAETTYRVNIDNTADVIRHERIRALMR